MLRSQGGGGGGELSLRREFSPASSQHLPRCRWGGAVVVLADGLDGKIKKGDPLSSSFPIRSSARFLRSEARGSSPQRKGSTLRLSFSEEEDREDVDEFSKHTFAQTCCEWVKTNKL